MVVILLVTSTFVLKYLMARLEITDMAVDDMKLLFPRQLSQTVLVSLLSYERR